MELRQLGSKIDEKRLLQAKLTEESTTRNRTVKRQRSAAKLAAEDGGVVEAEEKFAYIAGHTKGGVPYGVIWEELEAEDDPF